MKMMTSEVKNLLGKLYNLRGEDSVILKQMNNEREDALATQERTKNEKEVLLKEIERLTNEEALLAEQGEKLINVLSNINRDDFAFVLEALKLDFEPESLNERVNRLLPEAIDKVVSTNQKAKEKLDSVENEMNNAITLVEELGIRKDEAISNQRKLNEYFELALSGNINITRDEIVTLLEKFDFSADEQREAAKLLMFPEDALYEYDKSLNNGGVVNEEKTAQVVEKVTEETPVVENPVQEEKEEVVVPQMEMIEESPILDLIDEVEEEKEVPEVNDDSAKGMLEKVMTELGLNVNQFTPKAFTKILENYDEELLKKNVNEIKNKNMDLNIIYENYELLYDKELVDKINKLIEIGKEVTDICMMPSVLVKYDLMGLKNTINVLQISGLDPKKVPLMAY